PQVCGACAEPDARRTERSASQRGVVNMTDPEGDIEPLLDQVDAALCQQDLERHVGPARCELVEDGGEECLAKQRICGDAERTPRLLVFVAQCPVCVLREANHLGASRRVSLSRGRELYATCRPDDERQPQCVLVLADPAAEGLLRHLQLACRAGEALRLRDGREQPHVVESHVIVSVSGRSVSCGGIVSGARLQYHQVMATDVRVELPIARARADVAAYMFDPSNDAAWTTGVVAVNPLTPGRLHVGSRVERTVKFLGKRFSYTYEVVDARDDTLVEMTVTQPFPMHVRYELASIDANATK